MSSAAAESGFFLLLLLLLSVSVVQSQRYSVSYTSTQICAVTGSTVNMLCSYTYPYSENGQNTIVKEKFWFTKIHESHVDLTKDPDYSGRVTYLFQDNNCSLSIRDLRQSDSAVYKFRFITNHAKGKFTGEPGVTLSVTDLQLQVITSTELKCVSSCPPAHVTYVWYNKGTKIEGETTSSLSRNVSPTDNISCAVEGYETFRSASVYPPQLPSVSVSPSGEIVEGSSVTLTCSSDANPAAKYTWYNRLTHPESMREGPQFVLNSIQSSDSGQYHCKAENELGNNDKFYSLDVKYPPRPPSVSVRPSGEIVEGSSVTLTCSSDANPAANYTWYKNQTLFRQESQLVFRSIQSSDSGQYHCAAENELRRRTSQFIFISVKYPPRPPSVSVRPSGEIVEGSSVNLTCSSDANPAANYTWYKENEESPKATGQIFTITDIRPEQSGRYYCEAWNSRGRNTYTLTLTVGTDPWKLITAVVTVAAVLLVLILLLIILWVRKRKAPTTPREPEERPGNKAQCAPEQTQAEEQDCLQYATVHFKQPEPVYSNIRAAQPHRHQEQEETDYSVVIFNNAGAAPRITSEETEEHVDELYSTVNKPR